MTAATATCAFQGYWPLPFPASARTRVMGFDQAQEPAPGPEAQPSPESCWPSTCTYGEHASGQPVVTNLRLPGQHDERLLASVGLQGPYYNWNRWYLPGVGRYLELDPIALGGGLNGRGASDWYNYALGNPLRYVDPDANVAIAIPPIIWAAGAAAPGLQRPG